MEANRRALRARSTPAETVLWNELRNNKLGLKFKRQHSIGNYIADFYCSSRGLIIEADGAIHDQPEQMIKDKEREEYLQGLGFRILRFRNETILENIEFVKKEILKSCNLSPLSREERGQG